VVAVIVEIEVLDEKKAEVQRVLWVQVVWFLNLRAK
jgi:hypothetical protein